MRGIRLVPLVLISMLILATALVMTAGAVTPVSTVNAGKVYISSTTYDPDVFFPGDTGAATYVVTNGNNDTGIVVTHATVTDKTFRQLSKTYDSPVNIGPGQNQTFAFTVMADGNEGIYYPAFSANIRDAGGLSSHYAVQIDSTRLILSVVDQPDAFAAGKKKTLYLQVANPRKNGVKNVILEISGTGITPSSSEIFVGDLAPSEKVSLNFSVTPEQPTTVVLTLNYENGDNPHVVTTDIPIVFGVDSKKADLVISNVQAKVDEGVYHVTGEVNNVGLETANTIIVTSLEPAVPQDPYKSDVVGSLKPDDFGSFEVTFTADNTTSVPLQLLYKDTDGNIYNQEQDVKLTPVIPEPAQSNPLSKFLVAALTSVIVIIFVGGWVIYLRKIK